jgi:hypothetical protein
VALTSTPAPQSVATYLTNYRARIRQDRRRRYLAGAALALGVGWVLLAALVYLDLAPAAWILAGLALTVLLPLAALGVEAYRRPSLVETARLLDGRLDNQQRWLTAAELMTAPQPPPMIEAQLTTTARSLAQADPQQVVPVRTPWPAWALSGGLLLLALGVFVLKGAPDSFAPLRAGNLPPTVAAGGAVPTPTAADGLPNSEAEPPPPPDEQAGTSPGAPTPGASQPGQPGQDGQGNGTQQLAASRDAQAAIQRLARALNEQSVTQEAGDNLRQGNYDQAAKDLAEVGAESDQLSRDAQRGLAQALRRAAEDSATAPELAQAEQAAADALASGNYRDIVRTMKELGDAVQQTAGTVVPQEELARSFPEPTAPASQDQPGDQGQPGQPGDQGQQAQDGQSGQSGQPGQPGQDGQQGQAGSDDAQAGQPGNGTGASGQGTGDTPSDGSRVSGPEDGAPIPNVAGNPFELDGQPDPGQTRPAQPGDNPALTLDGGTGSGSAGTRESGSAGTASGERNNLPVERWHTVQRYFSPDEP